MILSVTFLSPVAAEPFLGGIDAWTRARHADETAPIPVECKAESGGVVLSWTSKQERNAGKSMRLRVPFANVKSVLEVDDGQPAKK